MTEPAPQSMPAVILHQGENLSGLAWAEPSTCSDV